MSVDSESIDSFVFHEGKPNGTMNLESTESVEGLTVTTVDTNMYMWTNSCFILLTISQKVLWYGVSDSFVVVVAQQDLG